MKNIIWKCICASFFILSCTTAPKRVPQSASDLQTELQDLRTAVATNAIDGGNCHEYFQNSLKIINEEQIQQYNDAQVAAAAESIMNQTWQIRLAIHKKLDVYAACRTDLRQLFYNLRAIEDLASMRVYPEKPMTVSDFKNGMQTQPIPLKDNDFYHGYLGPSGVVETGPVELQAGDVMLTRGGSFFSGILVSITEYPEQIDHFVLVQKDQQNKFSTIESYAQNGVSRYDIDFALKNENPRLVLVRPKDAALGARAADIMMQKVLEGEKDPSKKIAYDYDMTFTDPNRMICSAVTYWGYRWASNDQFLVPEERSTLIPGLKELYQKTGMHPGPILTAEDLELDSRFDLLLEFRDHRLIEDSMLKESVAQTLFKWMRDDQYKIRGTLSSFALQKIIFPLSRTRLEPLIFKLTGGQLIKGAPEGFVVTLEQLNGISDVLYKHLFDANQVFKKKTGWSMTHRQLQESLEMYRRQDYEKCVSAEGPSAELHRIYSPITCSEKN